MTVKILDRNENCKMVVKLFNFNSVIMKKSFSDINKICYLFPPVLNENKFIYGKLIEKVLINSIQQTKTSCIELDKNFVDYSYRNDCNINNLIDFSIKATKSGGNIILINKHYRDIHVITDINLMICHIKKAKLYVFPLSNTCELH